MPARPTDPAAIDGYRRCAADIKSLIETWAGCSRFNARKLSDRWRRDVSVEAARLMERLLPAIDALAECPTRDVDFDDLLTPIADEITETDL